MWPLFTIPSLYYVTKDLAGRLHCQEFKFFFQIVTEYPGIKKKKEEKRKPGCRERHRTDVTSY